MCYTKSVNIVAPPQKILEYPNQTNSRWFGYSHSRVEQTGSSLGSYPKGRGFKSHPCNWVVPIYLLSILGDGFLDQLSGTVGSRIHIAVSPSGKA